MPPAVGDIGASIGSGSFRTLGMLVAPRSVRTMSEIATGVTASLPTWGAADVTLKGSGCDANRLGVLGAARIALERVIPAVRPSARCEVRAIASRDAGRAARAAGAAHASACCGDAPRKDQEASGSQSFGGHPGCWM